ncbi:Gfo/Idh/MocA family protein [Methylosinus sp. LW4]|uniref:Gfo/Idh/MocA family protein n=1 Tax=Methylosinus sp. LW4 TaxID=136993 RepID=UPI0012FCE592|nr:Gfo/Idh/MocA family oxidoreductase [Methylosinus sp. LW4]
MEHYFDAAVIGCGRMGAFTSETMIAHGPPCWLPLSHAEAILSHPRLKLKALCDTSLEALNRAGEKFGVQRRYANPRDLLKAEKPALLGLATRTFGRAALIHEAVDSGTRAIHAEKPLCNSMAELEKLRTLFASKELFVTWGAIRRHLDVYRQALALARSGRYGALREVRVTFGSAPLYWTHSHSVDLLLFAAFGRRVAGVHAVLDNVVRDGPATSVTSDPRVISASVYFEGGLVGHITQALGHDFILSCEQGEITVRANGAGLDVYSVKDGGVYASFADLELEQVERPQGSLSPIRQLVRCLEGEEKSIHENTLLKQDIIDAQLITFAMLQSHIQESKIIGIGSIDPNIIIFAKTAGRCA